MTNAEYNLMNKQINGNIKITLNSIKQWVKYTVLY